jgi:hypothetical protein
MVRDYKHEYASFHGKPEEIKKRAMRNKAHNDAEKRAGKSISKDVDHKHPIRKGGTNAPGNTRVKSASENRAWRRGKTGYDP